MAGYQAAFVKAVNQVEIREIPMQKPQAVEVLLKLDYCGVCGSDILEARSWAADWKRFGHEIIATVFQVGSAVTGASPGDRVALRLSTACGECPACQRGSPRKCSKLVVAVQGGFGEYLIVPDTRLLVKIPPITPPQLAVFVEPLSVILDGFHTAHAQPGETLLVIGGGFLGKLASAAGSAFGLNVAGIVSRSEHGGGRVLDTAGGESFVWEKNGQGSGTSLKFPRRVTDVLNGATARLIVAHTAPPRVIEDYLHRLPFDTALINFGLSAEEGATKYTVDAQHCIFKRIQLLSAFPVPALYFEEAIGMIENYLSLFALIDIELINLASLADTIMSKGKTERKCVVVL